MVINQIQLDAIKKIAIQALLTSEASLMKAVSAKDMNKVMFLVECVADARKLLNETIPDIEGARPLRRAFPKARKEQPRKSR